MRKSSSSSCEKTSKENSKMVLMRGKHLLLQFLTVAGVKGIQLSHHQSFSAALACCCRSPPPPLCCGGNSQLSRMRRLRGECNALQCPHSSETCRERIQNKAPRVGGLNFFVLYVLRRDVVQVSFQFQLKLQRRPRARVAPIGCSLHALQANVPLLMCLHRSCPEGRRSLVS